VSSELWLAERRNPVRTLRRPVDVLYLQLATCNLQPILDNRRCELREMLVRSRLQLRERANGDAILINRLWGSKNEGDPAKMLWGCAGVGRDDGNDAIVSSGS
jgi:hypothetical protein